MIRPLTIASCLLAFGSGLYLYQEKHEVQLLDRTIERTVHETGAIREQSRLLVAEWTMLTNPERLRKFSNTYLDLKTISPTQFTSLADLDNRLPAPQAETSAPQVETPAPINERDFLSAATGTGSPPRLIDATATPSADAAVPADAVVADDAASPATDSEVLPVPPLPATRPAPVVAALSHASDTRGADRTPARSGVDNSVRSAAIADARTSEPRGADVRAAEPHVVPHAAVALAATPRPSDLRSAEQRPSPRVAAATEVRISDQHPSDQHQAAKEADWHAPPPSAARPIVLGAARPAPPSPPLRSTSIPQSSAVVASSAPYSGSLLGMARGSMPAAPRPTPVIATYNAN